MEEKDINVQEIITLALAQNPSVISIKVKNPESQLLSSVVK